MSEKAEKAVLYPAHSWQCPNCGVDNFAASEIVEVTADEAKEYVAQYGGDLSEWRTGNLVTSPDEVTCEECDQTFEVGHSWLDE